MRHDPLPAIPDDIPPGDTGRTATESQVRHFATIKAVLEHRAGLILISGPTDSGKTVLVYNALREALAIGRSAVILNTAPLEYEVAGLRAVESDPDCPRYRCQPDLGMLLADLDRSPTVEDVVGIQTQLWVPSVTADGHLNHHVRSFDFRHFSEIVALAMTRMVVAEFGHDRPMPQDAVDGLTKTLKWNRLPVHALHLESRGHR